MHEIVIPLAAAAALYLLAALAFSLLRLPGQAGRISVTIVAAIPLFFPLVIPAENVIGRALFAFVCFDLSLKLLDYARERRHLPSAQASYGEYLHFLVPFPLLLVSLRKKRRTLENVSWLEWPRAIVSGAIVAGVFLLFEPLASLEEVRSQFWLDHGVKMAMFVVLLEAGSHLLHSFERLAGYDVSRIVRNVVMSLTPADFWAVRYNTRVQHWLAMNVYRPSRGGVRGVLAVFFVSGLLHELMFDIATSQPDGYQFTFFMLQAPAVLISPWLERFAQRWGVAGQIVVRGLTIAWFYFTSMLFFRGVERIFPFTYASQPWLP